MTTTLLALALLLGDPETPSLYRPLDAEVEPAADPAALAADSVYGFAIGLHVGYFEMKDAEEGEMFYGIHARLSLLKYFAVEGSVDVAKADFIDDDAEFTIIPVQVSGLFFPFPEWQLSPYAIVGAGWYYTSVEFSGTLSAADDETDSAFGVHFGGGAELRLGKTLMIHADFRWIFLDEPDTDNTVFEEEEFDYWQFTLGGSIAF